MPSRHVLHESICRDGEHEERTQNAVVPFPQPHARTGGTARSGKKEAGQAAGRGAPCQIGYGR